MHDPIAKRGSTNYRAVTNNELRKKYNMPTIKSLITKRKADLVASWKRKKGLVWKIINANKENAGPKNKKPTEDIKLTEIYKHTIETWKTKRLNLTPHIHTKTITDKTEL